MKSTGRISWILMCGAALAGVVAQADDGGTAWRQNFTNMPPSWSVEGKPSVSKALFTAGYTDGTNCVLRMTADNASATLKSDKLSVDLTKTPIMRWRWKAVVLPTGGDGRKPETDDQAIGIYVSSGGWFSQQSAAFRWETLTPKGLDGRAKYGAGVVSIYWVCVRNQEDLKGGGWFVDQVNVADAYRKAFGKLPDRIGVGISCNSQYTGTKAEALLDWVEFVAAP
ncbi:MAG: DUF3047 domain-containing protein [bacterium]